MDFQRGSSERQSNVSFFIPVALERNVAGVRVMHFSALDSCADLVYSVRTGRSRYKRRYKRRFEKEGGSLSEMREGNRKCF